MLKLEGYDFKQDSQGYQMIAHFPSAVLFGFYMLALVNVTYKSVPETTGFFPLMKC